MVPRNNHLAYDLRHKLFKIASVTCVPIISGVGSVGTGTHRFALALMDPSICTGTHGNCRWCQLIGALAFDEPRPPLIPECQRPTTAVVSAPAAAAAAPQAELFRHPQGEAWAAVLVPQFHNRSSDLDFRTAERAHRVHGHFDDNVVAAIYREQLATCRRFTDCVRGIDFRFWTGSIEFDIVWRTLMFVSLQAWVVEAYIGVTKCCRWRWAECWAHTNMSPHQDHFDMMYPVCASYGESICALERLLQAKLFASCPNICAHGPSYKRGPVKAREANILYFCIRVNR